MLPLDEIREHLAEVDRLIEAAGDDPELLGQVLDLVTEVARLRSELMSWTAPRSWDLVKQALRVGIDQESLRNRPYNYSTLLKAAREVGSPKRKPGPRPLRRA